MPTKTKSPPPQKSDTSESAARSQRVKTLMVLGFALVVVIVVGFAAGMHFGGRGATAAQVPSRETTPAPTPAPDGMAWISGGSFWMGSDDPRMDDAKPVHAVALDGFWMDRTPVTNEQFERFVKATGYVTLAEKTPDPKTMPGVPVSQLVPGSIVFVAPKTPVPLDDVSQWWHFAAGASWRHPEGPDSDLKGREKHPVVQIAFEDAQAYAKWAGKRLPTEAEYEYAARGGLDRNTYAWGNDLKPRGKFVANIFQGSFPDHNDCEDGYAGTSPVEAFPANGFGLYDMGGNVWQWCADWYRPDTYAQQAGSGEVARNPAGPSDSYDPQEPGIKKHVTRGGSFLCSSKYCIRYIVGSRGKAEDNSSTANIGFRCVMGGKR